MSAFQKSLQLRIIGLIRNLFPVMTVGGRTFVWRDADVREIISRDKDFLVEPINGEKIRRHIGPFILGMDDGPEYQRDVQLLRKAVHKDDPQRIRDFFRTVSRETVAELGAKPDIVKEYTRRVPLKFLDAYFGTPGPEAEKMLHWNRSLFWDVFLDLKGVEEIRTAAIKSGKEMMAYLIDLIQENKQFLSEGKELKDNFLNRLILLQQDPAHSFDDKWIAGNVSGVYMGFLEPTNKALINILGQFAERKEVMALARKAAREDDVRTMAGLAWEALRFHPNAPALMRYAKEEQYIGGNGRKRRKIKAGSTLLVMTQSAMFDKRAVNHPFKFDHTRPMELYTYFGLGLHTCFGNYVNFISIPEMLVALLAQEDLVPEGKRKAEGPFPDQWIWKRS